MRQQDQLDHACPRESSGGVDGRVLAGRPEPISDEPIINFFHRFVIEIAFGVLAAMMLYVSFVPFDFTRHPQQVARQRIAYGLSLTPSGVPDAAANIGLYIPLGALGFAVCRRAAWGQIPSGIMAMIFATLLSFIVEYGQHWIASRVASWIDVICNALGAAVGILIVAFFEQPIRRASDKARWAARRNWWLTLCKSAVCLVLIVNLRPYDVVVDVFHTAAGLRHASFSPWAKWSSLPASVAEQVHAGRLPDMSALTRVQWDYAVDRVVDVVVYAGVAALAVLGFAARFRSRARAYLAAGFICVSLAGLATIIRVFLISHGLDTAHFVCGVIGWPLGCAVAEWVRRSIIKCRLAAGESAPQESPANVIAADPRIPQPPDHLVPWSPEPLAPYYKLAIALSLAAVIISELVPFDFTVGNLGNPVGRACLAPFLAHFHSRPNVAFFDLSGDFLRCAIAGGCLAAIIARRPTHSWRRQLGMTVLAVVLLSAALEALHVMMPTRQADVTTLIMGAIGGFAGAVALRWASDYRRSLPVFVVEDLLTSQLIEGQSYEKLPDLKPGVRSPAATPSNLPPRS